MKKSQLAINSVSTKHADLEEALAAYSVAGFTRVEFCIPHVKQYLAAGKTLTDVRRLLDQHKLQCIGGFEAQVQCFTPAEERAKNHELLINNAMLLAELGGTGMVVGIDGPKEPVADVLGEMANVFAALGKQISATGVTFFIEFNWSPVVKSLRTAVEVARRSRVNNVAVVFDPAHYHCTPTKFEMINAESVPFIRHIHLDDMADKPGELSNCNSDRVLPGKGCLDLPTMLGALRKHGYQGEYSIEMFNAELWAMPAAKAAKLMYDSTLPYCDV